MNLMDKFGSRKLLCNKYDRLQGRHDAELLFLALSCKDVKINGKGYVSSLKANSHTKSIFFEIG